MLWCFEFFLKKYSDKYLCLWVWSFPSSIWWWRHHRHPLPSQGAPSGHKGFEGRSRRGGIVIPGAAGESRKFQRQKNQKRRGHFFIPRCPFTNSGVVFWSLSRGFYLVAGGESEWFIAPFFVGPIVCVWGARERWNMDYRGWRPNKACGETLRHIGLIAGLGCWLHKNIFPSLFFMVFGAAELKTKCKVLLKIAFFFPGSIGLLVNLWIPFRS